MKEKIISVLTDIKYWLGVATTLIATLIAILSGGCTLHADNLDFCLTHPNAMQCKGV